MEQDRIEEITYDQISQQGVFRQIQVPWAHIFLPKSLPIGRYQMRVNVWAEKKRLVRVCLRENMPSGDVKILEDIFIDCSGIRTLFSPGIFGQTFIFDTSHQGDYVLTVGNDPESSPCSFHILIENLQRTGPARSQWRILGLCPVCGNKGTWINAGLTCTEHGAFAGI